MITSEWRVEDKSCFGQLLQGDSKRKNWSVFCSTEASELVFIITWTNFNPIPRVSEQSQRDMKAAGRLLCVSAAFISKCCQLNVSTDRTKAAGLTGRLITQRDKPDRDGPPLPNLTSFLLHQRTTSWSKNKPIIVFLWSNKTTVSVRKPDNWQKTSPDSVQT